jgi:hypothetical protein
MASQHELAQTQMLTITNLTWGCDLVKREKIVQKEEQLASAWPR